MNLFKLAAQIILIYILYRLVVNFVIPTYRNVKRFRKQFKQMQQQFEQQQRQAQMQQTQQPKAPDKTAQPKEGEYIEFEEIKS